MISSDLLHFHCELPFYEIIDTRVPCDKYDQEDIGTTYTHSKGTKGLVVTPDIHALDGVE